MIKFRKAGIEDIDRIAEIYSDIHTSEENGLTSIGWIRGVYPTKETAQASVNRGDMFVAEHNETIVGAAIINKLQVDAYKSADWHFKAEDNKIMVLHTLVISPDNEGKGYGKKFVDFYEQYALNIGCCYLRMDTNEKNVKARAMYKKLGYIEVDIVRCDFNGIKDIGLVLLEKRINQGHSCLDSLKTTLRHIYSRICRCNVR